MLPGCPTWPEEFAERYRAAGYWRGETFGGMLRERARYSGEGIAVVGDGQRLTYAELDERADRLAAGLRELGLRAYDRVVLQLPNIPEFFEVCFALFRIGAVPVFALPSHRFSEIGHFCAFTGARAYIIADVDGGFDYRELAAEVVAALPEPPTVVVAGDSGQHDFHTVCGLRSTPGAGDEPDGPRSDDVAFLQLSGGSTGVPKLIPRTHDDYIYSFRASAEICGLDTETVYLGVLPIAHNFPMSSPGTFGTLYAGGTVVLSRRPSPDEAFQLIESERVTITAVVPPLALVWLDAAPDSESDLSSLRVLQVGGAKFSAEAARRVRPVLGCTLQQVFGMAEGLVNYTRLDDDEDTIVTTQGRPICADDEIRIVDGEDRPVPEGEVGHLLTRGPYTIRGYYHAEEHNALAFTADGFYRTGDLVRRTPTGNLVVTGRDKDQINRGGEKVAAEEVENHLLGHPSVRDAAVVSMPDEFLGERPCAYVIPRGPAPKTRELVRFVRGRGLAAYKVPDRIEFVDGFPQTGVGKVSKKELRAAIAHELLPNSQHR